ncbi:type VI secretion system tip protein VgrG [Massilia atriviolacea]|uniref:Type VI secretion system tip protein VgrG n=1 Tax=Massilia atriviolacea TaxID=2495579 RepID=A0A430HS55_9BURK|nr:type VI secretion system tip protein VgrG [Massilia atriviolacea]RSZ60363.1 type VI secretion system tip protein VgrG [Massilia atriviolacea]
MERIVKAHTPLGDEVLLFSALRGTEALSQLFEYEVDMIADSNALDLKGLLGQPLTVEVQTRDGAVRYLNGIVGRGMLVGREGATARSWRYRAIVRPWLWLLTQTKDCKIFQNKSVADILQEVLGEYGFALEFNLTGNYRTWTYCVQYQETDFDFVSRLMEHEGIYYYFKHALGSHTLVLADDIGAHQVLPGYAAIPFFKAERVATPQEEFIDRYQVAQEIAPGSYVTDDYNFTKPRARLQNQRANAGAHEHGDMEIYDWMGGYADMGDADHYSRIRLEALQSERERDHGHATVRALAPGYRFTLSNCPRDDANREYLLVSVTYRLQEPCYASDPTPACYECDFVTQAATLPFRPRKVTPKPRTSGPQTATVVGPAGEEIWTDEYGRIKVQFRWDRYGSMDENSSCWLRVATSWAGSNFGTLYIPRVGQEVVVDFIGGEPDRPIVIGSTYNADQMPPFGLPGAASKSGIVTRSTKGGSPANANSLEFEDAIGAERLALHAEKDMLIEVENNKTNTVGNNQDETIAANHTESIGANATQSVAANLTESVGANKVTTIGANHAHAVGGTSTRTVAGASTEQHRSGHAHKVTGHHEHVVTGDYNETIYGNHNYVLHGDHNYTVHGHRNYDLNGNQVHMLNGNQQQNVIGDYLRAVSGNQDHIVDGSHVHVVHGGHKVTASNADYHTSGVHNIFAGDVFIKAGGGGGGAAAEEKPKSGNATYDNKFGLTATYAVDIVGIVKFSYATSAVSVVPVNLNFRMLHSSFNIKALSFFVFKTDFCVFKRDVNGAKVEGNVMFNQSSAVENVNGGVAVHNRFMNLIF